MLSLAKESGARELGCWALSPDDALGERWFGLAFEDGWPPHWMGIDRSASVEEPTHAVVETAEYSSELPYWSKHHESALGDTLHHFAVFEA